MLKWLKKVFFKKINLLSCFPSPAIIISNDGTIIFANANSEDFLETASLCGKNITEVIDIAIESIISQREIGDFVNPVKVIDKDKYVVIGSNKLPNKEKYILSLQNVTRQYIMAENIMNKQAKEISFNDNKNVFLVKMANNIKSPVHSIIGFSQAILEGLGGEINHKQEKYLKIIHKNSTELLILLEKLINLSQIEANLFEYNYKTFDIVNAVQHIINEFRQKAEEKRLQLILEIEEVSKKTCLSDENVVKIILGNLIENSILSCDMGSITVKISNPSLELLEQRGFLVNESQNETHFVFIEVVDTSNGVQEVEIEDIFNPYVEVNKATKKNVLRSLILAITKEFTKHLDGDIWIESELLKGTSYKVIIPIEKALK